MKSFHLRLEMGDLFPDAGGVGLQQGGDLLQLFLFFLIVIDDRLAGEGLDPAHPGGYSCLGQDLKEGDLPGGFYVSSAAEFPGEISHGYHPDLIPVFFAEESHGSRLLGVLQGHDVGPHRQILPDLFIDQGFHLLDFFLGHGLEMGKVKTQPAGSHQGSLLFYMSAKHRLQGLLQQMGGAVVFLCIQSGSLVYFQLHLLPGGDHAGLHHAHMAVAAAPEMNGILDLEKTVGAPNHAGISLLAAHGGVERRLLYQDGAFFSFHKGILQLRLPGEHRHGRLPGQMVIAHKAGGDGGIDKVIDRGVGAHVIGGLPGVSGPLLLLLHGSGKALLVDGVPLLLEDLPGQIHGETVGIVKAESILSGKDLLPGGSHLLLQVRQDPKSLVDGLVKLLFLIVQHVEDKFLLLLQLRVAVFASLDHGSGQFGEEYPVNAQKPSMAGRPADQTAEHIAPALVGGHDAVGNHKGGGTDVVRDKADGHIVLMVFVVLFAGDLTDFVPQSLDGIHIEDRIHILHYHRQTLQAHAGVDVLLIQLCIVALTVVVKLGKHVVPDFHVAVAVAAHGAVRFPAAVLFSPVIIDLGAGAAGAASVFPEIVFFPEFKDSLRGNADLLVPDLIGLVVLQIDGGIQPVRRQPYHLCQELPGPVDSLSLEIISEGEVAQHLKKSAVAGGFAHVLNIAGADALLTGGDPSSGRDLRSGKIGL